MTQSIFPKKLLRKNFSSDKEHTDAAYEVFKADFLTSLPIFREVEMKLKRFPKRDGREATFYHMTTEGEDEENREYDPERTERLPWARPLIENEFNDEIRVWRQKIKGEWRIHLWLFKRSYLLVIAERKNNGALYYLPWTAFVLEYEHSSTKMERRWKRYAQK